MSAIRPALYGWSANSGTTTCGTPASSAPSVVPNPPWPTIAAARARISAWGIQRSTRTLPGSGPSSAGSAASPTVTTSRSRRSASASIDRAVEPAGRGRASARPCRTSGRRAAARPGPAPSAGAAARRGSAAIGDATFVPGASSDGGVSVRYGAASSRRPSGSGSRPTHARSSSSTGAAVRIARPPSAAARCRRARPGCPRASAAIAPANSQRLAHHDVRAPGVDRELHAGQRGAGADAAEDLAEDDLVGLARARRRGRAPSAGRGRARAGRRS